MRSRRTRLHRARLAWLAALALVLLPTLARALQPVVAAPTWVELCRSGDVPGLQHALQACGYCTLSSAPLLPPATVAIDAAATLDATALPPPAAGRPVGPACGAAEARAPPRLA